MSETQATAREWALVLSSQGIASRIVRGPHGYALQVHPDDTPRAEAVLRAYEEENLPRALRVPVVAPAWKGSAPQQSALAVGLCMAGFYAITGPRNPSVDWFVAGSADAARILSGEAWRCVTALSLHADLTHLIANSIFGVFFLAVVGRGLGPGLGLLLVLASGVLGNLLNAALRGEDHVSIGASTAVFGAVGLLCGSGVIWRRRDGQRWRRVLLPLAAGAGLLAMLGSGGGRVDVFAHLFGFLAGVVVGLLAAAAVSRPPGPLAQLVCAASAAGLLLGSWWLALQRGVLPPAG